MGTDTDWPSTAGEKSSRKQEDGAPANSPPPSYLPNPPIESAHPVNTWSMWVQRLAPARPPSPTASATASSLAPNDPRISIVAPSPVSSRAALLQASGQHSRTSSALSGNHLHPSYIRDRRIQRPLSAKSRESLATLTNTSGEPSPVLSEITNRFPIPNALEARADKAQNFNGSAGTMASSNPFWSLHSRSGDTGGHASTQQRYSQNTMLSNDGGRNPFEFETETGAFDIDFSRIGVTPAHSGHSTLNPTTPVTPQNRRKSTSSLSLYSEEGHIRSLNPFLTEDNTPRHQKTLLQDQNSNNVVESANIEQRPWSPLEIGSAATSRKPSFVSSRSGPDLAAWEDEMLDPATHTPKTFSKIVDMYAGRAM